MPDLSTILKARQPLTLAQVARGAQPLVMADLARASSGRAVFIAPDDAAMRGVAADVASVAICVRGFDSAGEEAVVVEAAKVVELEAIMVLEARGLAWALDVLSELAPPHSAVVR